MQIMLCNIASKSRDSRDRANTVDMGDLLLRLDDKADACLFRKYKNSKTNQGTLGTVLLLHKHVSNYISWPFSFVRDAYLGESWGRICAGASGGVVMIDVC